MNLYLSQLKSLLYKNYKLKKVSGLKRSILFQVLVQLFIVIFYNFSTVRHVKYPSVPNLQPIPINSYMLGWFNGTISFYIPKTNDNENRNIFVNNIIKNKLFSDNPFLKTKIFDDKNLFNEFNESIDEKELLAAVVFNNYTDYTIGGPSFSSVDPDTSPIENDYEDREYNVINTNFQFTQKEINLGSVIRYFNKDVSTKAGKYLMSFSPLQTVINQAIIQTKTNKEIELNFNVGKLSKSNLDFEKETEQLQQKVYSTKIMVYPVLFIIQSMSIMLAIIREKEKKQEQGLLVIGVHPSTIWLSWEIFYLPFNLFVSITTALMDMNHLFKTINFGLGFLLFFIFGISTYGFSVMMTKVIKTKKPAIFVMSILYIILIFIGEDIYKSIRAYPVLLKVVCVIFSPFNVFVMLGRFIQKDIFIKESIPYDTKFYTNFILLICSALLYHLVVIVVEFFSFRVSNLSKRKADFTETSYYEEDIEEDPKNYGDPLIQVKNIFKVYKKRGNHGLLNLFSNENVSVLKNVSFNIYNNEIFAILGHNAAGKSTLIKIMTSLLNADHGNVYYKGLDLVSNVNLIRKNIGLCLQDTIVYDKLTVEDNLRIFAGLKGVDLDIEGILEDIALTSKRNSKMNELSGGQRRKVSIGVSLVGNPKFIFLDEPTTSLDPLSRRKIWDILMKIKKNRVIVLCTHYMDEADILADRKMIINNGRIRCLGSSVYLKNHFNMKYLLNIEAKMKYRDEIDRIVSNYIPDATYSDSDSHSITYIANNNGKDDQINCFTWALPMSSSNNYSDLFNELELMKGKMINRISLDSPYLEDLFIRLTSESFEKKEIANDSENGDHSDLQSNQLTTEKDEKLPKLSSVKKPSFFNKTMKLIRYRFKIALRDRVFLFIYFVVPIAILGLVVNSMKDTLRENKLFVYNERTVSNPKIYIGNQFNYDLGNSNLNDTLTGEVIENIILTSSDVENTNKTVSSSVKVGYDIFNDIEEENSKKETTVKEKKEGKIGLTYYTTNEMDILGQTASYIPSEPNKDPDAQPFPYYISSFDANLYNNTFVFDIYYNDSITHSVPVTINTLSNAILSLNGISEQIVTNSHPFKEKDNLSYFDSEKFLILVLSFCISFVVSFFGPMILRERNEKLLKLLNLSGITNKSYLLATFIVNCVLLYVQSFIIIIICAVFGLDVFRNAMNLVVLAIVLIPCTLSTIVFQYLISFSFNNGLSYMINILINVVPVAVYISQIIEFEVVAEASNDPIEIFKDELYRNFRTTLYPALNIPMVLFKIIKLYMFKEETKVEINLLTLFKIKDGFLFNIFAALISTTIYSWFALMLFNINKIMQKERIGKRSKKATEQNILRLKELDDDLYKEYQRVTNEPTEKDSLPSISIQKDNVDGDNEEEILIEKEKDVENETKKEKSSGIPIRVITVGKEYELKNVSDPNKIVGLVHNKDTKYGEYHHSNYNSGLVVTSLKNVTLGINNRECFGLIGPNGSGKTTLLNIITYNHAQTVGKVYYDDVENVDIKEDKFIMGYCSQNDVLWEELTLYEHLVMFIYLRGYSKKESEKYAEMYMKFCKIEDHKNKYPHELSGGTRRKLCILIALIGFSNKIMLDEPSSGMDPMTRRYIWNVLTNYKHNEDSLLVLTTHSMEEAEILCDRIGMLVNGELLALGTANQLKMKFGNKYMLEIQCTDAKLVDEWIKKDIPMMANENEVVCEFKSDKRLKYMFQVTENHGEIFRVMENYKTKGVVIDYSFCQNTLEDVFLKFAKYQENQEM